MTIRKVVEMTFAEEGVDVFAVADGNAAMLKFVEVQPDIVLVDVGMPGPDGYQICEMIKQDSATRHIPVLLLVGSFEPFDQDLAERSQADGFLTKPFASIRELVSRVLDLLGIDPTPLVSSPETADIEDLYKSSFATTMPIQDYDTEEDPLGDLSLEPPREASPIEDPLRDSAFDDEMIETSHPMSAVSSNGDVDASADAVMVETSSDFDWSPSAKIVDLAEPEPVSINFEPRFSFADPDPGPGPEEELGTPILPEGLSAPPDDPMTEPSDELIDLVAKRVVEKLSDHVIREIAQEAVPRIAEKLIREALDEDKKI